MMHLPIMTAMHVHSEEQLCTYVYVALSGQCQTEPFSCRLLVMTTLVQSHDYKHMSCLQCTQ
jgi:hypothetical protein